MREEEEQVKLILDGEVENLYSDRIELDGCEDLTLDELGDEYGDPFKQDITNLEQGQVESNGSEDFSNVSTVIYDDIVC
ncbi:MAG: hypothetical protein J07AB43_15580 [Candidatus Nanosalina sp. J07AB43]|nr:MAG: hypothetical protein J07AB43_15580 [Candidatus Nanosalina sp. J07AB43]